jgi:hypothetical protein
MKRIATLILAAGICLGSSTSAAAIDFKAKGEWIMSFEYGQNGGFAGGNGQTGWNKNGQSPFTGEDEFNTRQRVHLQLHAVASENLAGVVFFEIGDTTWGKASQGGALGADSTIVELKNAYLDWIVPQTGLKLRMGLQSVKLPSYTTSSNVLGDDVAAIVANYRFNDNAGLTAMWARPFNDNYTSTATPNRNSYMDNMDLALLSVPLSFDGIKVNPWGMYAAIGPNTFGEGDFSSLKSGFVSQGTTWMGLKAGLIPVGGGMRKDGTQVGRKLRNYGDAWWGGLTGDVTALDPFRLAWDVNYGEVTYGDAHFNRHGWLGSLLLEYRLNWGIPGIYGWYGSGDDGDPSNGSERMPHLSVINTHNDFSHFAFNGDNYLSRERLLGNTMAGTWGIGVRLKDFSLVEDLKHTIRINYIGGTNSTTMARRYMTKGDADFANATQVGGQPVYGPYVLGYGMGPMYLTTSDSAMEFGLTSQYQLYQNLKIVVETSYIATWLDQSRSVWGTAEMNGAGGSDDVRDPWNINMSFVYTF